MCHQCETKPVYEFTNKRKLCKSCYIHWFEKKVLYSVRKFEMLEKEDIVSFSKKQDFRNIVLKEILNLLTKNGRIKLTSGTTFDKLAVPLTTDLFSYEILNEFVFGRIEKIKKFQNKKIFTPLILFLDKEVLLYAKLKGLKFKKEKQEKNKIKTFVEGLEKNHPEVKRGIVNGFLK